MGCVFFFFLGGGLCCFFTVKDKLVANVLYYPNFILFYIVSNNYNCLHQIIQILIKVEFDFHNNNKNNNNDLK